MNVYKEKLCSNSIVHVSDPSKHFCMVMISLFIVNTALSQTPITSADNGNYALQFDGAGDYVNITSLSPIRSTPISQFTFEGWIYINSNNSDTQQFMEGWTLNGEIFLETDGSSNSMMFDIATDEGSGYEVRTSPLSVSTWYHIAATYDGHEQRIYLNGALEDSKTWSNTFTITTGIKIGRDYEEGIQYLNGAVDEVRIWNKALTLEEILFNMYRHLAGSEEGLVGYWPLNEGVGNTTNDFSGQNNHGTLRGATWVDSSAPIGTAFIFCLPNYGHQDHNIFTTVHGANTHFSSGIKNIWLSKEGKTINVDRYSRSSNTLIDAKFYIPSDAPPGQWGINVETMIDSIIAMPAGIEVLPPPSVTSQSSATSSWLRSVHAINDQTCWSVGNAGSIQKTIDGGATWESQKSGTSHVLYSIFFITDMTGWAVGQYGTVLNTSNGGAEWQPLNSGTSNNLQSVYFLDADVGWVVGSSGTILKTIDGGLNWESQISGTKSWLYSSYFMNGNDGWAVGNNGSILVTSDGGATWNPQISGTTKYLFSVHFIDSHTGWIAGSDGIILNTKDGGLTWLAQETDTNTWFRSLFFKDANLGWVTGNSGILMMTTDGGDNWSPRKTWTKKTLNSIYYTEDHAGWIVGESGTILNMVMSNLATRIEEQDIISPFPQKFQLSQNYPNPFNPNTTIEYSLPAPTHVSLKIYSIVGALIAEIVNEKQSAGTKTVMWDGTNEFGQKVSSGIYLYKLETDTDIQLRKMIVIK